MPMSWSCKKCTFLNSPSQNSACEICLSPPPPPSSPLKWSCKACTFLNPFKNSNCEVCSTRAPASSLSNLEDLNGTSLDGGLDSSVGSVLLTLRPCIKRKMMDPVVGSEDCVESGRFQRLKGPNEAVVVKV